jgi:hypothetical protein
VRRLALIALLLVSASDAFAQQFGRRGRGFSGGDPNEFWVPPDFAGNTPYDGRFTFARIKYRGYNHFNGREGPGWSHDYPRAEEHLMRIIREISSMRPFVERGPMIGGVIVGLEDKDLFKYPVAYFSEPGGWVPTEGEMSGMRNYLSKGGFIIFDDFDANDWQEFQETMLRVMPKHRMIQIPTDHAIFDSFFKIQLNLLEGTNYGPMSYWGLFQDNDPKKRLMAVVNLNGDIGEFWQWSDRGYNIAPSNEAYKLGVNYLIYALTH